MVSKIPEWNLTNKRVLLRADLNVPIDQELIVDDTRLQAIRPTLDLILKKGGHCIITTHIGKPKEFDPNLSTENLINWFKKNNYTIEFAHTTTEALDKKNTSGAQIILLENLRFFHGEKNNDHRFAQELANLGDYYVNDAFGTLHRTDTSIALVPLLFSHDKRSIGLLVEKELRILDELREHPQHPFVLVLGGSKAATKIPLIESLIDKANTILLCPALAFTFSKALGKPIGKSLVDDTMLEKCKKIIKKSYECNVDIVLPVDYQIAYENISGPLEIIDSDKIPYNAIGISIGPKTIELFKTKLNDAKTIFFNGTPGFIDQPETLKGAKNLLRAITETSALTIISGGDSIATAHTCGLLQAFTHISTGGGSALTYLSGQPLPGLECL